MDSVQWAGSSSFARRLLSGVQPDSGCSHISAGLWHPHKGPRTVLSANANPDAGSDGLDFDYDAHFWPLDPLAQLTTSTHVQNGYSLLVSIAADDLPSDQYRSHFYEPLGLKWRQTLIQEIGGSCFSFSIYWRENHPPEEKWTNRFTEAADPLGFVLAQQ